MPGELSLPLSIFQNPRWHPRRPLAPRVHNDRPHSATSWQIFLICGSFYMFSLVLDSMETLLETNEACIMDIFKLCPVLVLLVNENVNENVKDKINGLKQPGLTCKSNCMTNKMLKVNLLKMWAFLKSKMASKMVANSVESQRWIFFCNPLADLGDLWVIWYVFHGPGFIGNTSGNIWGLHHGDISIMKNFGVAHQWKS